MADKPSSTEQVALTVLDRQWLRKCIDLQRKSLIRSMANEMDGSDVKLIRQKEVRYLSALEGKFQ